MKKILVVYRRDGLEPVVFSPVGDEPIKWDVDSFYHSHLVVRVDMGAGNSVSELFHEDEVSRICLVDEDKVFPRDNGEKP